MSNNKPLPKDHILHHASKEIIAAVEFYERMIKHHLGNFSTFESDWREFLQKLERVWNKTQAAASGLTGWPKLEAEINKTRNEDPLLSYLRHARNADEHSIQQVAADWDANLRETPVDSTSVRLDWEPWDRPLLPVKNRGVIYQPPRKHLGIDFTDKLKKGTAEPIIVADMALHFYRNLLNRVINEVILKQQ
jgi:hypothetical protein